MKKSILFICVCFLVLASISKFEKIQAQKFYYNEGYKKCAVDLLVKRDFKEPMTIAEQEELQAILED